jgi:hypothetical protein
VGHRLKVGGVHAAPIAAKMVDLETNGDWSNDLLVDPAMSTTIPSSDLESPIAAGVNPATPEPAVFSLVDLRPESLEITFHAFASPVALS